MGETERGRDEMRRKGRQGKGGNGREKQIKVQREEEMEKERKYCLEGKDKPEDGREGGRREMK